MVVLLHVHGPEYTARKKVIKNNICILQCKAKRLVSVNCISKQLPPFGFAV